MPCVCIDVRGKIPEGANVPTEQTDHTLFVETVVVACTASSRIGDCKISERKPTPGSNSPAPDRWPQPLLHGPIPPRYTDSFRSSPHTFSLIPHAKKKYQLPKLSKIPAFAIVKSHLQVNEFVMHIRLRLQGFLWLGLISLVAKLCGSVLPFLSCTFRPVLLEVSGPLGCSQEHRGRLDGAISS